MGRLSMMSAMIAASVAASSRVGPVVLLVAFEMSVSVPSKFVRYLLNTAFELKPKSGRGSEDISKWNCYSCCYKLTSFLLRV